MDRDQEHVSIPYASKGTPLPQQRSWRNTILMLGAYFLLCTVALKLFHAEFQFVRFQAGNFSESIFGLGRGSWLRCIEIGLTGCAGFVAVRMALQARSAWLMGFAVLLAVITAGLVPYLLLASIPFADS